ncbi:putative oxidoreductase [Halobacteriovorax marinus SJ]|uniref:Oxidoreductase n=1 Tax=Halobacteriovorax marinus (strain ATCC BAA-682 / DSM 15412 / SJ) TaxID=862908 RepID=E1X520_HALMS|nr:Gfo/Idh/MocA family oxidoreductase [Halobacteriovorax marinus]CBW25491.1 putative oxidoreductase [Halobacteriovorax marinus SJ]
MNNLKVAVVGYGHLGRWHADKVKAISESELSFIVEPFAEAREKAKEAHPDCQVVANVEDIFGKVDAAIVVTPTSYHFQVVKKLLEQDIHVFCEKPMTSTVSEAKEIGEILSKKSLTFQVGHSERCHQIWERREEYSNFFEFSPVARINRVAPFKGRATDVDVVQDLMIHDIDLLLYLFKEKPISLSSRGFKIRTDKWDHVSTDFNFSSGLKANITVSRNHVKEMRNLEVTNHCGTLFFDLFENKLLVGKGEEQSDFVKEIPYEKRDHLLIEQQRFYNSILKGDEIFVDYDAGLSAVVLIEKVLESLESGKEILL